MGNLPCHPGHILSSAFDLHPAFGVVHTARQQLARESRGEEVVGTAADVDVVLDDGGGKDEESDHLFVNDAQGSDSSGAERRQLRLGIGVDADG